MPESNEIMSVAGQLVGLPLAGPESFSAEQLAYLKRALGVDETVLWSGNQEAGNTVILSESSANFESIAVYVDTEGVLTSPEKFECLQTDSEAYGTLVRPGGVVVKSLTAAENGLYCWGGEIMIKGTSCQIGSFRRFHVGQNAAVDHTSLTHLLKVVGINRISGGN